MNFILENFEGKHVYVTILFLFAFWGDSLDRKACERQSNLLLQVSRQMAEHPARRLCYDQGISPSC